MRFDVTPARPVWLSGEILTFLNKLVMPAIWLALMAGIPLWVFLRTGHVSIAPNFRFIAAIALIATALLLPATIHLQRVGYSGRNLIVANYWRKAQIPFEQVDAVEPVWWYKGRIVRIQFRQPTPFGDFVYYMPKWGPVRCLFSNPEDDLREMLGRPSS